MASRQLRQTGIGLASGAYPLFAQIVIASDPAAFGGIYRKRTEKSLVIPAKAISLYTSA